MAFIANFKALNKGDAAIAGGKGASLGEMTQAGIPVPPGFVVLSDAFEYFLKETDLVQEIDAILHKVNHKEIHTVERASEEIKTLILGADMPKGLATEIKNDFKKLGAKYVAVRSSATAEDSSSAAWAGQLESYLNTTEGDLLDKVKHCWASLFTPRAIFYRFEKDLHKTKISVAVVVQKMVESQVSGIAFSVHPVTEDYNQLIIEAGFGLGEAIVSGQITPDSYVVEKQPRRIIDKNVQTQAKGLYRAKIGGNEWHDIPTKQGEKQVLSDKEILELSEIILKIENHYGFPCDIEWAFENGKFYIVQSRPITTLTKNSDSKKDIKSKSSNPTNIDGKDWKLVVTRNMSHWHNILSLRGHAFNTKDFGVDVPCLWLCVTIDGTRTSVFMEPENLGPYSKAVMNAFSTKEKVSSIKKKYQEIAEAALKALKAADKDLNLKTWSQFLEAYQRLTPGLMITTNFGRGGTEKIIEILKNKGIDENEIHQIISTVTYPLEHTPLFDSQLALMKIGSAVQKGSLKKNDIESELESWLAEYGAIPVNFCEEPWNIQDAKIQLDSVMKKDCERELKKAVEDHDRKADEKKSIFKKINDPELEVVANALAEATYMNEFRKNVFCRLSLGYRGMFTKIAALGGSQNWRDIFYLVPEETTALLAGEKLNIPEIVSERRLAGAYINDEGKEIMLDQDTLINLETFIRSTYTAPSKASADNVDFVKGFSANRGKVKGVAKIMLSSKDFAKLNPNEILVTTMTSVDFVPVMERAAAFVTNEGGITSHAAIVAREMNKPCVIGTKNATQVIKDGDVVEVDADNGIVRILGKENEKPKLVYYGNRDFMIAFSELMIKNEKTKHTWLDNEEPAGFYAVTEYKNNLANWYFDLSSLEWTKEKLFEKVKADKAFVKEIIEKVEEYSKPIEDILRKPRPLSRHEMKSFLIILRKEWSYLAAMWWLIEDLESKSEYKKELNALLKLRKATDYFASNINTILKQSLEKAYPKQKKYINLISIDEFLEGKIPSGKEFEERQKKLIVDYTGMHAGEEAEKRLLQYALVNPEANKITELSGTATFKGLYKGKVKIVFRDGDAAKVKKGDVLVASSTIPDWISAMKLAGAIIADEGGMLSHAAILSRELKKPCIIGTKIATKVLKDGDVVEVDAEKGIVHILTK